jgi:hypothetical protein
MLENFIQKVDMHHNCEIVKFHKLQEYNIIEVYVVRKKS